MEEQKKLRPERTVLAGLDAGVFSRTETATEQSMDELDYVYEDGMNVLTMKRFW